MMLGYGNFADQQTRVFVGAKMRTFKSAKGRLH